MLVKIIKQNWVDIEKLIDRWNNDIENEEENTSKEKFEELNSKSLVLDSLNELNGKIDCSSFIPITVQEKKEEKKIKVSGVPKLNFALWKIIIIKKIEIIINIIKIIKKRKKIM